MHYYTIDQNGGNNRLSFTPDETKTPVDVCDKNAIIDMLIYAISEGAAGWGEIAEAFHVNNKDGFEYAEKHGIALTKGVKLYYAGEWHHLGCGATPVIALGMRARALKKSEPNQAGFISATNEVGQ